MLAALAVAAAAASVFVSAYLTDSAHGENHFSVGRNDIEIQETFAPAPDVNPGQVTVKHVTVKNVEGTECYTRVRVRFTCGDMLSYVDIDYNTTDWVYNSGEDCYYYRDSLKEGEETKPLFTKVTVKPGVTQEQIDEVGDFDVIVHADSIQKGNAKDYLQAWASRQA